MATAACGPADLLAIYLTADRPQDAVALLQQQLTLRARQDPRQRSQHHACYFPYARIQQLRSRLVAEIERGGLAQQQLLARLDGALEQHMELVQHDTVPAQASARALALA